MGVEFVKNFIVGKTASFDDLKAEGYKAFFVGSGAGLPRFMNIPGENYIGVMSSNEYLTRVNLMGAYKPDYDTPVLLGKKVAVVGAGPRRAAALAEPDGRGRPYGVGVPAG